MNDELFGFQQVSYIDGKFQADVISKIMTAKVRLAGNKLCENAPEVCSEAEAVSANVISDGFCDLWKVSHTDKDSRPNVTSEIMVN